MEKQSTPTTGRRKFLGMVAAFFGLTLVCYWPALQGGLIWDDAAHVTRPELRSLTGLGLIWSDVHQTQQYYPILHSAFWLEHRLWGDAPLSYHLLNIILHATCGGLLAHLLRRLWIRSGVPAGTEWFAGLIFAVHPVCVESVAWISEQKNTLSLLFYFLAAIAYLDFDGNRRPAAYARASLFFLLALGTKSVTGTLPAALLVVLWWQKGRLGWKRDTIPLLPWLLIAVVAGLFTAWVEREIVGAAGSAYDLSLGQRTLLAGRAVWFYAGKLVWPVDLLFVYPRWDVAAASAGWYGWLVATVAVTTGFCLIRRQSRGPLAGWLFFVGTLFPALGFFNIYPFVYSYVADHFQYVASVGIIAMLAAGAAGILARLPPGVRPAGWILGGLLVAGLSMLTNRQSRLYRDEETLYRVTLGQNQECWMAHNNLANLLSAQSGGEAEAIRHYEEALRLRPAHVNALVNLANLLARMPGRQAAALNDYEKALRLKPDYAEAHVYLANLLAMRLGRKDEALAHYEEALRLRPDLALAHNNLAMLLATLPGLPAAALSHYETALRLNPGFAEAHNNLANLLVTLPGRAAEAQPHYEEALRLNPDLAAAHQNLAIILTQQGRISEAITHCTRALEINPENGTAREMLAHLQQLKGP